MPARSDCLSADAITHYVQGTLPDAQSETLEEHVQNCPACLEALSGKAEKEPFFNAALSPATSPSDLPAPAGDLAALKTKLKALRLAHRSPATDELDPYRTQSGADRLTDIGVKTDTGWLGGYRIIEELGHGGMGAVFRAEDPQLKRHVAVKVMLPEFARDRGARARFLREAKSVAALQHDNVVPIYHIGEDRDIPYLVMPLLCGEPLDKRLAKQPPLTLSESLRIGRELALGLAAAHSRGLVHRDIKPANIWLETVASGQSSVASKANCSSSGLATSHSPLATVRVKILDFGLARQEEAQTGGAGLTLPGSVMGTPEYMSPEQARGEPADFRSDLYNVGLVLYRLTAGKLPFTASTPSAFMVAHAAETPPDVHTLNPNLPPWLAQTIMQLLQKKPADRPASAQQLADMLGHLLLPNAGPTEKFPRPPVPVSGAALRWSRPLLALAAVAMLLLVPAGVWYFWPQPIAIPPTQQPLITTIECTVDPTPYTGVEVEMEMDLSLKKQLLDLVIIRKGLVQILRPLPDGFDDNDGPRRGCLRGARPWPGHPRDRRQRIAAGGAQCDAPPVQCTARAAALRQGALPPAVD